MVEGALTTSGNGGGVTTGKPVQLNCAHCASTATYAASRDSLSRLPFDNNAKEIIRPA
jgi:hypothetical protein